MAPQTKRSKIGTVPKKDKINAPAAITICSGLLNAVLPSAQIACAITAIITGLIP